MRLGLGQRLQQDVVKGGTSTGAKKPVDGGLEIGEIKLGVSLGLNRGPGGGECIYGPSSQNNGLEKGWGVCVCANPAEVDV